MKLLYLQLRGAVAFLFSAFLHCKARYPLVFLSINTLRHNILLKGSNDFIIDGEDNVGDEQQITEPKLGWDFAMI